MLIDLLVIHEAGGNPTCLVLTEVPFIHQGETGKKLIKDLKNNISVIPPLDQVAFLLDKKKNFLKFRMAGGEYCGNALLALGYYLNMEDGEGTVEIILGNNKENLSTQNTTIYKRDNLVTAIVNLDRLYIEYFSSVNIFHMRGISHAVLSDNKIPNEDKFKDFLRQYNLISKEASGIVFIEDNDNEIFINPYIYVSSLDTFINENSCGSASIAAGLWKYLNINKDITDFPVIQKTGEPVYVSVKRNGNFLASLTAEVEIVFHGKIDI